jgi:hypothetical protein
MIARSALAAALLLVSAAVGAADSPPPAAPAPTYADLAALSDGTPLVLRAQVTGVAPVEPARARGVKPGHQRLYVEAKTQALLFGESPVGEALKYLVDVPLDAKGKVPKLKKQTVIVFARPARPGELQLIAPDAQLAWSPALEPRLLAILGELTTPGAPGAVTGVREAIHVTGALAGQGETQLCLSTAAGEPAAITVTRAPGSAPAWSASFSELVGASGAPPRDTLAWYRLACSLPAALPPRAHVSPQAHDRAAAEADYRFVLDQLGPCARTRR